MYVFELEGSDVRATVPKQGLAMATILHGCQPSFHCTHDCNSCSVEGARNSKDRNSSLPCL
jgi:hypothetical protein